MIWRVSECDELSHERVSRESKAFNHGGHVEHGGNLNAFNHGLALGSRSASGLLLRACC